MQDVEALNPFDPAYPHLWVKIEHLARYLFARDRLGAGRAEAVPAAGRGDGPGLVLDVACGTGYGARELAAAGLRVVAVDRERQVRAARETPWPPPPPDRYPAPAQHGQGNITWLGLDLDRQDLARHLTARALYPQAVCCFETLEHVADPTRLVSSLAAVLPPGGRLFLSVPMEHKEPKYADGSPRNPYHLHLFSRERVEGLLGEAGFRIRSIYGQTLTNLMFKREVELLSGTGRGPSEFHPTAADTLRHYARLMAYPDTWRLHESYALLWEAERTGGEGQRRRDGKDGQAHRLQGTGDQRHQDPAHRDQGQEDQRHQDQGKEGTGHDTAHCHRGHQP